MKRKIISNTYLRDIEKYQIKLYLDEDDYYVCVKKLIDVREKFIIHSGLCVMDNGYYVFEVVPKDLNYAMRLFLDDKKNPLEYYFDITKNNGLDELTKIPFYDDLYLDITYLDGEINILDEDELLDAFKSGDITKEDLDLVYRTRDVLLDEITNGTNKIMNIDFTKYLNDF
ncbi:MAG: DUF402 domain-containing protein [Bacilli bacterium]|nr:DUF402 domain-containing protein [Bacilli bacterium]